MSNHAFQALAKAVQAAKADDVTVRTGTLTTGGADSTSVFVALDNDPSATPVAAIPLTTSASVGDRVVLLAYPPRGLLVLGRLDSSDAVLRARNVFVSGSWNLVTSTSYGTNVQMPGFTFPYPPSGTGIVYIRSSIQWTGGALASGDGVCFSFNVRDNTADNVGSPGTIRTASSDDRALICRLFAGAGAGNTATSSSPQPANGAPGFTEYFGSAAILLTGLPTNGTGFLEPQTRTISAPAGPFWAASRTEYIFVPQP
jgi:hypothetical protein